MQHQTILLVANIKLKLEKHGHRRYDVQKNGQNKQAEFQIEV